MSLKADTDLEAHSLAQAKTDNVQLIPLCECSGLDEALQRLLQLDSDFISFSFDGTSHVVQEQIIRQPGACGMLRIDHTSAISGATPFSRTVLRCVVTGCTAKYEYRVAAAKADALEARNRPGLLLARPRVEPESSVLAGKAFVTGGPAQEHSHVEDVEVRLKSGPLKRRLEKLQENQPEPPPAASTTVFRGIPAPVGVSRLIRKTRRSSLVFPTQSTSAASQRMADEEFGDNLVEEIDRQSLVVSDTTRVSLLLAKFGLIYVPEVCSIFCQTCSFYLSVDFQKHSRRVHKLSISRQLIDEANKVLQIHELIIPEQSLGEPCDQLPLVPVEEGFFCPLCGYCLRSRRHVVDHFLVAHEGVSAAPVSCYVQNPLGGSKGRLIRVKAPGTSAPFPPRCARVSEFLAELTAPPARQPLSAPTGPNSRNDLFQALHWFADKED